MRKIAVASDNKTVCGHFGHCESFEIFETEGTTILKEESVANPGNKPGFLPNFLHDAGVNVIVSGGMGGGAVDIFNEHGIEVVLGAQGNSRAVVQAYLDVTLEADGSVCSEHNH